MKKLPTNFFIDLKKDNYIFNEPSLEEKEEACELILRKVSETKEKPNHFQWNDYWSEIKEKKSKIPSFFNKTSNQKINKFYRYNGSFIKSDHENLPAEVIHKIIEKTVKYISQKNKAEIDTIVEFGCGNGHNLQSIKKLKLAKNIYGCDFSKSAVEMVNGLGFESFEFDMTRPSNYFFSDLNINADRSIFFTSGSLEQLGENWKPFFDFLKKSKVKYVFHIEPIKELYSKIKKIEKLALQFHNKKKYLDGYFSYLKKQKHFNLSYSKSDFGTLFDQGFNVLILELNEKNHI
jgi:hypothetical protein